MRIHAVIRHSSHKQTRRLLVFIIAVALIGIAAARGGLVIRRPFATTVVTPPTAIPLAGDFQTMSNLFGDQVDTEID